MQGPGLSQRQGTGRRLAASGKSRKQMAQALGISENTVKVHVGAAFAKLGVHNMPEAVAVRATRERERDGLAQNGE